MQPFFRDRYFVKLFSFTIMLQSFTIEPGTSFLPVIALGEELSNKNIKMSSFKSSENIQKKEGGQTDLFRIINPLQ